MTSDLDQLRRLRVAKATGQLPNDLAEWLIERVEDTLTRSIRVRERNRLLGLAALMLDRGGRLDQAEALAEALDEIGTGSVNKRAMPNELRATLLEALRLDPATPRSARHLFRIIR